MKDIPFWASALVGVGSAASVGFTLWRLKVDLSRTNFLIALIFLGGSAGLGYVAWLVKGFSAESYIPLVGMAYFALLVGSWGHPGQMVEILLKESSLSGKAERMFQIRLAITGTVIGLIAGWFIVFFHWS